ncbi:MAG: aminoglycoside phosphotransferase family protein [Alphaproteobacteria bacterium]
MTGRPDLRHAFAQANGLDPAQEVMIAGDASFRSYYRYPYQSGTAIVMDAPPEDGEDCRPFIFVARWLKAQGWSAPDIIAEDVGQGFLILEDLGDDLFKPLIETTKAPVELLYGTAVDLLVCAAQVPAPAEIPAYDEAVLAREVELLTDYYWPLAHGENLPAAARDSFFAAWQKLWPLVAKPDNPVLVMRDYHAENLIWLPARSGVARVGLLDFQDALAGHAAYDLISLADDARRDVSQAERRFMFDRYVAGRLAVSPDFNRAEFDTAAEILAAQRNTKIIGIFARLAVRDGKPLYLDLLGRVWGYLTSNLEHAAMTELKAWFDEYCPHDTRKNIKQ